MGAVSDIGVGEYYDDRVYKKYEGNKWEEENTIKLQHEQYLQECLNAGHIDNNFIHFDVNELH